MGNCETIGCSRMAEYEFEGKKYCLSCYAKVIKVGLPNGKTAMGAATVVIN